MKFPLVFVAGTFDRLHKGHEFLLSQAFKIGERVTIGLTTDQFVKQFKIFNSQFSNNENSMKISNFKLKIREYDERKKDLEQWLKDRGYEKRSAIVPIDDPYEPAASFPESVTLLVTPDNKARGQEINNIRKKRGLPPFTLLEVPLIKAEDNEPISSTRVRKGEIDAEGRLILPDNLRPQLQQPLGPVLHAEMITQSLQDHKNKIIITVGDVATKTLLDGGVIPSLMIIDNRVERKPYKGLEKWRKTVLAKPHVVISGPGYISKKAVEAIKNWASNQRPHVQSLALNVIEVDGEEDLLAIPAIIYAPIGSVVYYGQPAISMWACGPAPEGLVEVEVTKEKKSEVIDFLKQFEDRK